MTEVNLSGPLKLTRVAHQAGVTPCHLARVFAETTGQSVMRYVWRRRLTRAAEALAYGKAAVLQMALDAQYASQQAFARAFRAEFGLTPRQLRHLGQLDQIAPTQPIQPRSIMDSKLNPPVIETMPNRRFAGLVKTYTMQTRSAIPAQWVAYNEACSQVGGAVLAGYFGVVFNFSEDDGTFDYMCGQEVPAGATLPADFAIVSIAGRYARFVTKGHISTMNAVWEEVYGNWLTRPDLAPRPGPSVEYYPPEFDGMSGEGGFEVWIAVQD